MSFLKSMDVNLAILDVELSIIGCIFAGVRCKFVSEPLSWASLVVLLKLNINNKSIMIFYLKFTTIITSWYLLVGDLEIKTRMTTSIGSEDPRNQTSILIRGRENHVSPKPDGQTRHTDVRTLVFIE